MKPKKKPMLRLTRTSKTSSRDAMKKPAKPEVVFTAQADRDIYRCGLFLERIGPGRPKQRMREIRAAARRLRDAPKIYPVQEVHPISGLEFRRRNVGQFTMLYAYLEHGEM